MRLYMQHNQSVGAYSQYMRETHMHTHGVGLLLYGSTLVLLGDPEAFTVEPIVDVSPVDVVAPLDVLPDGEGRHLAGAWFDKALELCNQFGPKTYGEAVRVDAPPS